MININHLNLLEALGFGSDIDALESQVSTFQDAAAMGNPIVTDTVYDTHTKLLRELKPDSEVLNRNWESIETEMTDMDELLDEYGMCSILTAQTDNELMTFGNVLGDEPTELAVSIKENGHAIRAVYAYGELVGGTTRGRHKKGRDILRHLKARLPNKVECWSSVPLLEVRGEALVSLDNFSKYFKNTLKTPLSTVTSLMRDSVTDDELAYIDIVCYKIICKEAEELGLFKLSDEYTMLVNSGFDTPLIVLVPDINRYNVVQMSHNVLAYFEQKVQNGEQRYDSDGLVAAINDRSKFYALGKEGNRYLGNLAIKMGEQWECNMYSATIESIVFTSGKKYLTPKAVVTPTVCANGSTVTTVPLYNIDVMERYGYTKGKTVYFKYGGETGVTCVTPDGKTISEVK